MQNKSKVITVCGSLKFIDEINKQAERLALEGHCVLSVIYPTKPIDEYSNEELATFGKLHKQKIDMSDAIFVVNVNGYIGNRTQSEIEYAKALGKEILYLENCK